MLPTYSDLCLSFQLVNAALPEHTGTSILLSALLGGGGQPSAHAFAVHAKSLFSILPRAGTWCLPWSRALRCGRDLERLYQTPSARPSGREHSWLCRLWTCTRTATAPGCAQDSCSRHTSLKSALRVRTAEVQCLSNWFPVHRIAAAGSKHTSLNSALRSSTAEVHCLSTGSYAPKRNCGSTSPTA